MDQCPAVGDVISSPRYGIGIFVVETVRSIDVSETLDPFRNLTGITARRLKTDGSYDPEGDVVSDNSDDHYTEPLDLIEDFDNPPETMNLEDIKVWNEDEIRRYTEEKAQHDKEWSEDRFRDVRFHGHMTRTFFWESPNTLLP